MPVERDGQEGTSPSGESAPVSRTSKPSALETINVILKPSTVKDISNQSYELTLLEPDVAQFEVSVGNDFKLGHLRQSIIRGAVSHGQYRNLIGCRSSIFYRPKGARKSVTFLKDTKSLFSIVNSLLEDSEDKTAVTMAFSVGQRHDDDIAINDDDDVDNMDARQVAGWSATSAMASPAPKMEVVSNQGRRKQSKCQHDLAREFVLKLYRTNHQQNKWYHGFCHEEMEIIIDHFKMETFGGKKDKRAWEKWNPDSGSFPTKSHGPDWKESAYKRHENSVYFTGIKRGKKPPDEVDEPVPPSGDATVESVGDSGRESHITMNDVLTGKHKNINQPQAVALLAIAKSSPMPPSSAAAASAGNASAGVSTGAPKLSVIMKRELEDGDTSSKPPSSQVFVDKKELYTASIKDVVMMSVDEDKGSGVFALKSRTNEIVVRCGEGEWRLKSKAIGEKKIGWVADNHGAGDKVLVLTVAEVVPQAPAAALDDLFGDVHSPTES